MSPTLNVLSHFVKHLARIADNMPVSVFITPGQQLDRHDKTVSEIQEEKNTCIEQVPRQKTVQSGDAQGYIQYPYQMAPKIKMLNTNNSEYSGKADCNSIAFFRLCLHIPLKGVTHALVPNNKGIFAHKI